MRKTSLLSPGSLGNRIGAWGIKIILGLISLAGLGKDVGSPPRRARRTPVPEEIECTGSRYQSSKLGTDRTLLRSR